MKNRIPMLQKKLTVAQNTVLAVTELINVIEASNEKADKLLQDGDHTTDGTKASAMTIKVANKPVRRVPKRYDTSGMPMHTVRQHVLEALVEAGAPGFRRGELYNGYLREHGSRTEIRKPKKGTAKLYSRLGVALQDLVSEGLLSRDVTAGARKASYSITDRGYNALENMDSATVNVPTTLGTTRVELFNR